MNCKHCAKPFEPKGGRGRPSKYCSRECQGQADQAHRKAYHDARRERYRALVDAGVDYTEARRVAASKQQTDTVLALIASAIVKRHGQGPA